VRGFVAVDGGYEALLEPEEARALASLALQLSSLLAEAATDEGLWGADPAVARLLPDAYRDDEEAAAEWRRLSRRALAERKSGFAARFADHLASASASSERTPVVIDEAGALDWLRAVGDLRLVLSERMGIASLDSSAESGADELYQWLAWIQDDLVRALDAGGDQRPVEGSQS
jgi:hypothetical protein